MKNKDLLDWIKKKKAQRYHLIGQVYEVLDDLEELIKEEMNKK